MFNFDFDLPNPFAGSNSNKTGIYLDYDFVWNGKSSSFIYEIPELKIVADGIRAMFKSFDTPVDGKDTDVVNMCVDLHIDFEDNATFIEYCKGLCEEDAKAEFEADMKAWEEE